MKKVRALADRRDQGGALPEAQLADHLTTIFDNNYQTNLAVRSSLSIIA